MLEVVTGDVRRGTVRDNARLVDAWGPAATAPTTLLSSTGESSARCIGLASPHPSST